MNKQTCKQRLLNNYTETSDGCWLWNNSTDKDGYGYIKRDGKTTKAHRASYSEFIGEIPPSLHILHKCNNPSCINPHHLYAGTPQDNSNDRANAGNDHGWKGYDRNGEKNSNLKLTDLDVLHIRENYKRGLGPTLAKKFKVTTTHIHRIVKQQQRKGIANE